MGVVSKAEHQRTVVTPIDLATYHTVRHVWLEAIRNNEVVQPPANKILRINTQT